MQASRTKQRSAAVAPTKSASARTKTLTTTTSTALTASKTLRPAARLASASALTARKALVDANAASYNVKDPHTAVDTLRSLLGVLPARPGSAHLRMTPNEHALAVRLVGIIEPVRFSSIQAVIVKLTR